MLWTTLIFVAVTAILVAWHVRKSRPAAAAAPRAVVCPRCKIEVAGKNLPCPKCGVAPQVYEVVAAPASKAPAAAEEGARLHAVVRADVCVGCGACVSVCPEPGAIALSGKLAIVDTELCKAHGECVTACPVNGIFLSAGAAVQRVEVPEVDFDFQSNVPGIYVVGELGGRGLIKNAINEGKLAARAVARAVREGTATGGSGLVHDVVIVGSGPAGLSAALECQDHGLRYVVLEQGDAAESIRRYPRHKLLLAEPVELPVVGDLWIADATKETLLGIWENIIRTTGLEIRTGHKVTGVKREAWGFHVVGERASWPARHVILATGRRGSPRALGVPGEDLPKVVYDIAEMDAFAGRRVLVVGGGDSALESAIGLARQPGTTVHLSYRSDSFARAKERNRGKLAEAIAAGRVTPLLRTQVREIRADAVLLDAPSGPMVLPNDDVVIRIGGEPSSAFLEKAGVRRVIKEIAIGLALACLALPARAQVSPGPLSSAHRALEGNANCLQCHASKKEGMDARCLACHGEIALLRTRNRGYHAPVAGTKCAACHPEHAGESFQLIDWPGGKPEAFDHAKAGWPLAGKHAAAACGACHQGKFRTGDVARLAKVKDPSRSHVGLDPSCAGCHADAHKGALGAQCATCHGYKDWKTTTNFDHAKTAFPLTGKHVPVPCAKCHQAGGRSAPVYKPLPHDECSACHADAHAGRLGPRCTTCHVTAAFQQVSKSAFDHDRTRWPLRGAHRTVACARCHEPGNPKGAKPAFATCGTCHRDPHAGRATLRGAPADCSACHGIESFRVGVMDTALHAPEKFPLTGKHAPVPCASCHTRDATPEGRKRLGPAAVEIHPAHDRCMTCHKDAHEGQLASRPDRGACEPCHTTAGFKPSLFGVEQHRATALALEGKHAEIPCAACHGTPKVTLRGIAKDCVGCHRDPHRFSPQRACADCHGAREFVPSTYGSKEHARAAFVLDGAHRAVPCSACHDELKAKPGASSLLSARSPGRTLPFKSDKRACADCHADPHGGQFALSRGNGCERCHGAEAFRPAAKFDHDRDSKFKLGAAHRALPCSKCHVARPGSGGKPVIVYRGTSVTCEACHGSKSFKEGARS